MAEPFQTFTGVAAVLPMPNVDTDVIIRIERLTEGDPALVGRYAFESLRYRPDGSDDPDFPLNRPAWRGAPILIAGPNFGCGSSREGAVTALAALGVRVVIAESFGDIFYANCFQNGLLPVRLPPAEVEVLANAAETLVPITVDLDRQMLSAGAHRVAFEIDPMRKESMVTGLDDLGLTLRDLTIIDAWQDADRHARPWIWILEDAA